MSEKESNLSIIELPTSITKIVEGMNVFDDLKQKLLKPIDKQNISSKQYIKRSGWRKLAFAFNISDEIIKAEREEVVSEKNIYFVWRIWVKVTAPNNRSVIGIGSCSSNERNFAHIEHDVYATAHTRAKNRAISDILGSGEVSAEEIEEQQATAPTKKGSGLVTTLKKDQSTDLYKFHTAPKSE